MKPLARLRAWWWKRRWVRHAIGCRLCEFMAIGFAGGVPDTSKCCDLGGMTVTLAAHYAAVVAGLPPRRRAA